MALRFLARLSPLLLLTACADLGSLPPDRFRAVRGEGPPEVDPPLRISNPPTAILAAASADEIRPAAFKQAPAEHVDPLRQLADKAAASWDRIDSYIVRLRRREVVGGRAQPEELLLMKYLREPRSVYFKWLGEQAKGRECIFVPSKYDGKIQTRLAAGDIPFMPAGMRFSAGPDDAMVRAKCRYPITEAGFGTTGKRFGVLVTAYERGDRGCTFKYLGNVSRPEYSEPVEGVQQDIPPKGCDPLLPEGGQRLWFFDQKYHLPILIVTTDAQGREVEYYCHDRFEFPVHLDDRDFNPDLLWSTSKQHSRSN